ncbi:MAG TPA: hypothetical protein VMM38_09770 [Aridibacter sp.]|nr:hypothetical protein [Aridibacter sp.]
MKYATENELLDVLGQFESGTILRDEWGHPEHLIVAYFYCSEGGADAAYPRMKNGILKLLEAFGIDKRKEMPYHETMTMFWIRTIGRFVETHPDLDPLEGCAALIASFGRDYPLEFYSSELLYSDRARAEFVEPDIKPFKMPNSVLATQE